ncbi:MAG: lysoplasmalogenase [Cocleimonas sp.]
MQAKILLLIFIVIAVVNLTGVAFKLEWVILISKPLLMPTLLVWAIAQSHSQNITLSLSVFIALVFSFLGDTFLLFDADNELFFLLGLGSFLVAQTAYAFTFFKDIHKPLPFSSAYLFAVIIFVLIYVVVFFYNLFTSLGGMTVPVFIYALAVGAMGLMAALRYKSVTVTSFYLVLVGATLFIISDTFIALDKFLFNSQLPFASLIIMSTYILAQFLIVQGLMKREEKQREENHE